MSHAYAGYYYYTNRRNRNAIKPKKCKDAEQLQEFLKSLINSIQYLVSHLMA